MIEADVAVLGAGPAGCAAAIMLATAGLRVVAFGRAQSHLGERIGESLSPGATALVDRLGLRERFLKDGHLPCHANASAWGTEALAWVDFLRDPRGHGFHLDRARFEALLRARVVELGVRLVEGDAPRGLQREGALWWSEGGAGRPSMRARYVVDASGRAAGFAREQGATRLIAWEQVALVTFARAAHPSDEAFTLIEAVPDGFWYSAPIPGGRLALALFTDAGLHDPRGARTAEGLDALLDGTTHTRRRLHAHGATLEVTPRFVDAGSSRLDAPYGPGWVAAGDAALAYDPISAHGLTLALRTGIDAAAALVADARGESAALAAYGARLARAFGDYRGEALRLYRSERRWPDAPYWRCRHELPL